MLLMDGNDAAVIGIGERCGQPDLVCYDFDKLVKIFMDRDGMTLEDAKEFIEYNILGAWVGDNTPMVINKMDAEEVRCLYG